MNLNELSDADLLGQLGMSTSSPEQFSRVYGPAAERAGKAIGVNPTALLSQWGLETGWGKSIIPGTNNLGNIKDFTGSGVAATDNMNGSRDKYRKFGSPEEFADHYAGLIQRKYKGAIGAGDDIKKFTDAMVAGGYAEDPAYAEKIAQIYNKQNQNPVMAMAGRAADALIPAAQAGEVPSNDLSAMSDAELIAALGGEQPMPIGQENVHQQPPAQPQERAGVQQFGDALMGIPRQIGLTARYGMEGLGQAASIATEPIRQGLNAGLRAAGLPQAASTGQVVSSFADTIGLPNPKTPNERVAGDVSRLMAGGGGLAGGAGALAKGATGLTQSALTALSANPGQQLASAAGAGALGGSVREAGGGAVAQGVAGLAGGLAGPMALSSAQRLGAGLKSMIPPSTQRVDQELSITMQRAGLDWDEIPERIRQTLRTEASGAIKNGKPLSPDALRRLAEFSRVEGATPTQGMLTLDPVQITRERNLAKMGANSSDEGLQGLALVENRNNDALVRALNRHGAGNAPDSMTASEAIMGRLKNVDAPRKAAVDSAYQMVRDSAGRYERLNTSEFSRLANDALDADQLGFVLPEKARGLLNDISSGKIPLDVNVATQLDKRLSGMARDLRGGASPDRDGALAVDTIRRALHDTPLTSQAGAEAMELYDTARSLAAWRFRAIDSTPALKAALDGAQPDKFVQQFIISNGPKSSSKDVANLARELAGDPAATEAAKGQIAAYLKDRAVSGASDETAKFSASAYAKALSAIGDRKLSQFFNPDEMAELEAIKKVSSYMLAQPVGSAVNNSNSGALALGRGLDFLNSLSGKVPLGIGPILQGTVRGMQQNQAQRISPALIQPGAKINLKDRLIPASVYGSLLAAPGVKAGEDNQRP